MPDQEELDEILARWPPGEPRVCVVGDLILDRYTWGDIDRVSPEAPVPVLQFERHEDRPGGAAAVAALLAGMNARATVVGVAGDDAAAEELSRQLATAQVRCFGIPGEAGRPTTLKQRFMSRRHGHVQLLRLDVESTRPVPAAIEARVLARVDRELSQCAVVAISDYGKGVCTPRVLRAVIDGAVQRGIPVLVDPARGVDYSRYAGATLLIPNRHEMEVATGERIADATAALALAARWARQWRVAGLAIKLDQEGIVHGSAAGESLHYPTRRRTVYDLTGAGDTVLAALTAALGRKLPISQALAIANIAGGLQVERVGVAAISLDDIRRDRRSSEAPSIANATMPSIDSKIIDLPEARRRVQAWRAQGQSIVFTNGCFAALHAGHVAYLQEAKGLGDRLIVAINSASSIRRLKGDRPILPDDLRLRMLATLDEIDGLLMFDDLTPLALIEALRPDTLVKGGATTIVVGRELVESYGGRVMTLSFVPGASTTQLLAEGERGGE